MTSLPYRFRCTRCAATIVSPMYDQPTGATCAESDFEHEWHRQVDPKRVAFHEAAHAIAAAVLLGTDCVRLVRMERPSQSDTLFIGHPTSPQALLVALCGPAASARVGDVRDGADGDLREFRRGAFGYLSRTIGSRSMTMDDAATASALSRSVEIMRRAFAAAASDLVTRWELSIDALAAQALQNRRLEGEDLSRAITQALAATPGDRFDSQVLDPDFPLEVWRLAVG
jgi:hypothetical protein